MVNSIPTDLLASRIINAAGTLTRLSGARVSTAVAAAMSQAAQSSFDMWALLLDCRDALKRMIDLFAEASDVLELLLDRLELAVDREIELSPPRARPIAYFCNKIGTTRKFVAAQRLRQLLGVELTHVRSSPTGRGDPFRP